MINVCHLFWIIPLSAVLGVVCTALLKIGDRGYVWQDHSEGCLEPVKDDSL